MKKKLSLGLVLVIVLVLAAVTALAAALLWEQQVVPMKEIEQAQGDYVNWPISQKQVLIRALIDSGNMEESNETTKLFDGSTDEATKHAVADQLILTLTGHTDINEISVDIITYAVMGSTDTWSPEQRVWWQQVTDQFHGNDGAPDTLVTPGDSEIPEAEAIAIAKNAIIKAYDLPKEALDNALPVADLYTTKNRPDYRRWNVQFKLFREGSDSWLARVYSATVDEKGNVIEDPDVGMPHVDDRAAQTKALEEAATSPIIQAYGEFAEKQSYDLFCKWPVELKAAYSQKMRPLVHAALESGELAPYEASNSGPTDKEIIASTTFAYGLPSAGDLQQADALEKAKQVLTKEYGLDEKMLDEYSLVYPYFDVTNPDVPLWKFLFHPKTSQDIHTSTLYKVELDARTGELVAKDAFKWQGLLQDLAYDLKLY